ncbi:MAG: hypothetical protein EXR11_06605 [Rhodospirillaceae bacterium]|nr:hypothetical protein [Rhodospirillaceae bacterium]
MIPKRKPLAANRKSRRAQGVRLIKLKRPPQGPSVLIEAFKRIIVENDQSVSMSAGLMMGEKGWTFHRAGEFRYAVASGKTRVTLHALPMYCQPKIHTAYKKRIANGDFGKGCIRFKFDAKVDLDVIATFIRDCAEV